MNKVIINKDTGVNLFASKHAYTYYFNNDVLFYYLLECKKTLENKENKILDKGMQVNRKYVKTLKLLIAMLSKNNIQFTLFKTYKYFNEVNAGDIDIIINVGDVRRLIELFNNNGFRCDMEGKYKIECRRDGYSKIEPRINISHHGKVFIDNNKLVRYQEEISLEGLRISKSNIYLDIIALILNFLYGPKYFTIYDYILLKSVSTDKLFDVAQELEVLDDVQFFNTNVINRENIENFKFPVFLNNFVYISFWFKKILGDVNFSINEKFKHLFFFFYIKYLYVLFSKLYFERSWWKDGQ